MYIFIENLQDSIKRSLKSRIEKCTKYLMPQRWLFFNSVFKSSKMCIKAPFNFAVLVSLYRISIGKQKDKDKIKESK